MNSLVETLRNLGRMRLMMMAVVGVALIALFVMIAMRVSSPGLAPLYTGLAPEDSAKITSALGKLGVPYDVQNEGATVLVPSERVLRLRMTMAEQGLPSNGSLVGYEIFDKSDTFGSSNFVMNVNMIRALEGELGRTIRSFQQVESARVHLVVPKRELFTKEKQEPSASVALNLRGGQELSKQEVGAITHLVASAVPGLKPSRVNVVDSYGRLLARGDGGEEFGAIATMAEEYRQSYENRMRDRLEELLEKVIGPGKVKVQVAADMNFDRIVTDSEKFDPEGQVARSVQSTSEREDAQDKAQKETVTVANQLPSAESQQGGAGGPSSTRATEKTDETTNFEISKTTQRHVKEGGSINRLSVAVLVDGNYTTNEDGEKTYAPREEEELQRLASLVKSAIVYDEKRGDTVEVVNMQFTTTAQEQVQESFLDIFKNQLDGIIQTLIIAGVAVLAILTIIRPSMQHMMKHAERNALPTEADPLLAGANASLRLPSGAAMNPAAIAAGSTSRPGGGSEELPEEDDVLVDIENVKGRIRSSTLRRVTDTVDKNPEEAMTIMRQWLVKEAM